MKKHLLAVGIIFLFLSSVVAPISTGLDADTSVVDVEPLRDYYGCYSLEEIPESIRPVISNDEENQDVPEIENNINSKGSPEPLDGLMDSAWPMCSHDVRHTGRSPFNTSKNTGYEKWQCDTRDWADGDIVIDKDGIIYIGSSALQAVYPNGTLKWQYVTYFHIENAPAIDENHIIYFTTGYGRSLYAVYTSNGTLKWKLDTGLTFTSPAIGDGGVIYLGVTFYDPNRGYITALYPDGSLKWKYETNDVIYSSPAIGDDGTVYCGSHDTYLYALYPNNGTLKWRYKTGNWIRVNPCIGDDGTIYIVSLDNYLHAVNPNGTRKWRTNVGAGTSPTIGQDGTIYCGYSKLHAVNPTDGNVKWSFDVQGKMRGATPCNSIDGTIYLGNYDGSEIVAVNSNGTEKWRASIGGKVESAPCIDEDGTVYIGDGNNEGCLHAFGNPGPNPFKPTINGPVSGKPGTPHTYTFTSIDPEDDQVSYYIDWGDGNTTDWTDYHTSGGSYSESHTWTEKGTYTLRAKARDTDGYESDWGTLTVSMPRDKATNNVLLLRILERFPNALPLLRYLLRL